MLTAPPRPAVNSFHDRRNRSFPQWYDIRMYDGAMEDFAVALAIVCDHVSDKADSTRYSD